MNTAGFWDKLHKPMFVLAPMADVTDASFRYIIAKYSKYAGKDIGAYGEKNIPHAENEYPHVLWTEFVSADGLVLAPEEGKKKLMRDLMFTPAERPIVAQFFTSKPENMRKAAVIAKELGFDGVDINMGCPDKGIEKQGAGAAMIKTPKLAREIIRAAKEGGQDLPVSVKTRIGYNRDQLEEWLPELLAEEPALITIHARTRKEMSKVPARWEYVKRAVEIRDQLKSRTLIFGNGDVLSIEDARKKVTETGCDGVMLGRAIFGNPWVFRDPEYTPSVKEKLEVLIEHTKLYEKLLGDIKSFSIMKKHFKAYVDGFDGAKKLRVELMDTQSALEVELKIREFLESCA